VTAARNFNAARRFVGEAGPTKGRSPLGELETWADAEVVATEGASSMKRSTRFKVLWTVWMAGGGLVTWVVVYAITGSVGWAVVALLVSGVVLNAVGQAVVQPMNAKSRAHPS
jgi:ABC-type Fe3+-siderophore transport system permease subunit